MNDLNFAPDVITEAVIAANKGISIGDEQAALLPQTISTTASSTRASEVFATPPTTVVKPPKPQPHDGRIDAIEAHNFIDSMEDYNTIVQLHRSLWTASAVLRLKGNARTWWRSTKKPTTVSWEEFKAAFITAHSPPETIMRAHGNSIQHLQQAGRPVAQYTHEFRTHLHLAADIDAPAAIRYYVSGLDKEIQLHVRLSDPKTLDDAVLKATMVDYILGEEKGKQPRTLSASAAHSNGVAMELDNIKLGKITPAERKRLRQTGGCFRCRRPGHFSSECPRFRQPPSPTSA
ncbi:hypothetical protein BGW42_002326 [Actinomortierella wolfii]|nr:hypothetical protein BGW42_002326 [Actinomortierella wolfii]